MYRTPAALAALVALTACASAPERPAEPDEPVVEAEPVTEEPEPEREPAVEESQPSVFQDARLVVRRNDPEATLPGEALYLMAMDGTVLEPLPVSALGEPRWSPDGERLAVRSENQLAVIERDGSVRTYVQGSWPTWSPDGRRIAFHRDGDIHVLDLETGQARCMGPSAEWEGQPAWLADGRIAFIRRRYEGEMREQARERDPLPTEPCQGEVREPAVTYAAAELGLLDPAARESDVLAGGTDAMNHLAAAPDSPRLAYMNGQGDIVVLRVGDPAPETVVAMEGLAQFPRFDPPGRRIIFTSGSPSDLYVVDLETGVVEAITSDDAYNNMVDIRD